MLQDGVRPSERISLRECEQLNDRLYLLGILGNAKQLYKNT
jgi:hypothetical protein